MLNDYLDFVPKLSLEVHKRVPVAVEMALRLEDAERAHLVLDEIGVPRVIDGQPVSLANRVVYLNGMLDSAKRVLQAATQVEKRIVRYSSRGR